ncbi:MAG: hydroxymethylglutaryl-CoA reductase, degradative [Candidatus Diapherotrites archaeon]|nr:hydroxymethylglutaryl-CoA reductase, degradative [Candidatus Diapherotrites archaeon]
MDKKSFEGFYKKSVSERQEIVAKEFSLTDSEKALLAKEGPLPFEVANRMIENVIGTFPLPLGVATNFVIDGKEYIIPFALEEPSVVAAASNAAKLSSGFTTSADEPIMIGQIQIVEMKDTKKALKLIQEKKSELLKALAKVDAMLVKFGGGPRDIKCFELKTERGAMLEVQLLVDVRDAMGANAVNTMNEKLAPMLEEITGGKARLRIISNLAVYRKARAKTIWTKEALLESVKSAGVKVTGEEIVERILDAYAFACATPFRASTHNKGIMNGIDAVVIATGNDFRAIEAGAHTYAWYATKEYKPLTKYYKDKNGNLVGEIELPLALGLVGGATKVHPVAQLGVKILGVKTAQELARIIASVGLAQNFAAMRAIVTTGIQAGHLKLHAYNLATTAGAKCEEVEKVALQMIQEKAISYSRAEEILKELRRK